MAGRRWTARAADRDAARSLARATKLSEGTAQILLHRGFSDPAAVRTFLAPKLAELTAPDAMHGRAEAADRLARAVRSHERVVVFGDYDVDGTTSTTILSDILEELGGEVIAVAANRFEGGYGFSAPALLRVLELRPRVLVTCDCGSSDAERVARARDAGVDVVVVDHHLVPKEPLPAFAFLNPHLPECGFPYKHLTSAGLALSLGAAVRAKLGVKLDVRRWLDLVALGTIADVAPLDGDNRRLVRAGLEMLAAADARPGVLALREVAKLRTGAPIGGSDVGFRLAPRINAAGRLGDPAVTLALLRAKRLPEARELAAQVEKINDERKNVERQTTDAAIQQVLEIYGERPQHGIVAAGEGWHRGVVGITAARLVDRFDVPALVVALEHGMGHGSGRAPKGFPLYDALVRSRDTLLGFGGHQAAAGLTVELRKIDALRAAFAEASRDLTPRDARAPRAADLLLGEVPLPPADELRMLEPLGEGNAEPTLLAANVEVERAMVVGESNLRLVVRAGDAVLDAFGWDLGARAPQKGQRVTIAGQLRPDDYHGEGSVELRILDLLE